MDAPSTLATYALYASPGQCLIAVNGEAVDGVTNVRVEASVDEIPTVTVRQLAGAVHIEGQGIVHVVDPDLDPTAAIVAWLADVDPSEVQARALMDHDVGSPLTTKILRTLAEMAVER